MNWEQEKVYCKKRAKELKTEMEAAVAASNEERFIKAYQTAMLVQRNLPPAYLLKLSSEHLSGNTRKVQVKKAVHFAGAGLPQPMKKPQAAAEKAMRKHTLIP